ncbi:MAG: DNA repair protein RecO [Pseudomonadota bacterium]|nr:DNA repair protein RecO [Pseudomonadota bacterium]
MRRNYLSNIDFSKGYIIHKKPFEEHKLLLSIFDDQHGMVKAIARRPSSKKNHCLEPFIPLALQIKTTSGLANIQRIEPISTAYIPPLQGLNLWAGLYCNELLFRLCHPQETYPKTFSQYSLTLNKLSNGEPIRKHVRLFEYVLLQELGFSLDFSCLDYPSAWFTYCQENGLIPCSATQKPRFRRQSIENLYQEQFDCLETQKLMKQIFQVSITRLLGHAAIEVTSMLT